MPDLDGRDDRGALDLARTPGVSVGLYANGTVVLGGSDGAAMRKVEAILEQLGGTRTAKLWPAPDRVEAATGRVRRRRPTPG